MTPPHAPLTAEHSRAHRSDRPPSFPAVRDWELVELAAEGTLAQTYRARPADAPGDRPAPYALKLLRQQWEEHPGAVELFRREAVVGQTVRHPHLISILAAGVKQPPYFVVAPWLSGCTLAGRTAAGSPLDLPVALWVVRQVAEALEALGAAGWRHGDIKPGNIFLSPEGHVTLLDLGFARRADETGSVVERCFAGTCNYVAPETVTSALRADIRSDIYSLGVVLFEMLSGRLPFEGKDLAELATLHRQARVPELRRLVPQLPPAVVRLVEEMLAKQPLRRPQTPRELIDRLAALEILTFSERAWG
jgi:serine/threonine protein kinase